jgi:hypothetical protein
MWMSSFLDGLTPSLVSWQVSRAGTSIGPIDLTSVARVPHHRAKRYALMCPTVIPIATGVNTENEISFAPYRHQNPRFHLGTRYFPLPPPNSARRSQIDNETIFW